MESYTINDSQWRVISSALNVAISVCLMHKKDSMQQMMDAAWLMDDIANGATIDDEGEA